MYLLSPTCLVGNAAPSIPACSLHGWAITKSPLEAGRLQLLPE